jgi:hypothetical protein
MPPQTPPVSGSPKRCATARSCSGSYTPRPGPSLLAGWWLSRQCLDRRVPDFETLQAEVVAWQERRDEAGSKIDWRFRTENARLKLKRLYPSLQG